MTVRDLIARVEEWRAVLDLDADGRVVVREYGKQPLPPELLEVCREHKQELAEWLRWDQAAIRTWRTVFRRIAASWPASCPLDTTEWDTLNAVAEAAHLRHDRAALVDALLDLEALARATRPQVQADADRRAILATVAHLEA